MPLTGRQVSEMTFKSSRKGYSEAEVDDFLDVVEHEIDRLNAEIESLQAQLAQAQLALAAAAPQPVPADQPVGDQAQLGAPSSQQSEMEEMLRRTLLLAQRTADEVVAEARADADQMVASARLEADAQRAELQRRIAEEERNASERAGAGLAEFETSRRRLQEEVTVLREFEADFRGRLKAYLELQLRDLDAAQLVPPHAPAEPHGRHEVPADPTPPAVPSVATAAAPGDPAGVDPSALFATGEPAADELAAYADEPVHTQAHAEPPVPAAGAFVSPVALPELPPLPSWMSADAGSTADQPPPPVIPPTASGADPAAPGVGDPGAD